MTALEENVLRLRDGNARLNQTITDWKRCALAIIGPSREHTFQNRWIAEVGPGMLLWTVNDNLSDDAETSSMRLSWLMLPPEAAAPLSFAAVPSSIEIYDVVVRELLYNCTSLLFPPPSTLLRHIHYSLREYHPYSGRD